MVAKVLAREEVLRERRKGSNPAQEKEDAMTYSESAESVEITTKRAMVEVRRHGINESVQPEWNEFVEWLGDRATVDAGQVLEWLGY